MTSVHPGARLVAVGSSVAGDQAVTTASGMPSGSPGLARLPAVQPHFRRQVCPAPWALGNCCFLTAQGGHTHNSARGAGRLHADPQLAVQVDDRVVDEGEDSQFELGLAGVTVLDHAGVSVGDGATERGTWRSGVLRVPRPGPVSAVAGEPKASHGAHRAAGPVPTRAPPVVDEAEGDGVLGVTGGRRPAFHQHHLQAALLPVQPHLDLDVIAGRHAVILRYWRISNKQLHFRDKCASAVQVFRDAVDPAEEWRSGGLFLQPLVPAPQKQLRGSVEISEDPPGESSGGHLQSRAGYRAADLGGRTQSRLQWSGP